ncbi:hypothetical protein [Paraburkholderia flagellata]|uniref:hypothetical protein n=1 Tax=Paraburkholderia flagellata TaxID=2883241 RepID=UPI001F44DCAF|nr:hypothetical protein [Paraburkholderia flagellata]
MIRRLFAALCALLVFGCGQHASESDVDLTGTYAADLKGDGHPVPFLKVERSGDAYLLFEYVGGKWVRPVRPFSKDNNYEAVRPLAKADLESLVKHPLDVAVSGVQTDDVVLAHVPAGWTDRGRPREFHSVEGWFAITLLGAVDLHKL